MPPAVLAIDTSGRWCSAAVLHGDRIAARRADVGNAHSEHLLAMVDEALGEASLDLRECGAIAFGAGPGSFTGLRVACAVAQGLAFGGGLRVAAVGTLDAMAAAARNESAGAGAILVAQDARMGEVYWALYDASAARVVGPGLASPEALRHALRDTGTVALGCGNAWAAYGAAMDGLAEHVVHRDGPDAVDIARIGMDALRAGLLIDARDARPIYVRNEVAETTAQRAARARDTIAS
jgi:tRNA threonylcarbamoyladenosine biosynthesis protein TsaB